jgi:hypothetical protein
MCKKMRVMRTKLYIIAILSVVAVAVNAQTFQPATIDNSAIQSQKIMQTGTNYSGQVYEPFSSVTPSEQSAVGASSAPAKVSGPRRGFDTGAETGRDDEYPIGDALLPLLLMAAAFGIYSAARRKRLTAKQ